MQWWPGNLIGLSFTGGRENQTGASSLGGITSMFPVYDTDEVTLAECVGNTLGNIPTAVSSVGGSIYRAFFLRNGTYETYNDATFHNIKVWHTMTTSNPGDAVFFATDSLGIIEAPGEGHFWFSATMSEIPDETTAPTVSAWLGAGETLSIDTLETHQGIGLWFRQSVSLGSSWELGSVSIRIEADVVIINTP